MSPQSLERSLARLIVIILSISISGLLIGLAGVMMSSGKSGVLGFASAETLLIPWTLGDGSFLESSIHLALIILFSIPLVRSLWLSIQFARNGERRSALIAISVVGAVLLAVFAGGF